MKVLYVNHTGQVSGGEKSLLEVLRALPPTITPMVACPDGPLASEVGGLGVPRIRITGTDGSLKLHLRHTPMALARMARAASQTGAIARRNRVDLTHANSIRAGLVTTLVARTGGPPTVVHVRDRLPHSRLSRLTLRWLQSADGLIANSHYTAAAFATAGIVRPVHILGNPVDLARFDPEEIDRGPARAALGIRESEFVATVVAQITPWKGQEEAIRAIAAVRRDHPEVKLLLVGSAKFVTKATRYDNRSYLQHLHRLVEEFDLAGQVGFLGERDDVPTILRASDVLLIPSWEEPFGRSMIEAMAMRLPVIATNVGGPAEVITHGHDGLLIPPRDPGGWAGAITAVIETPDLRDRLVHAGWLRAHDFGAEKQVQALLTVYESVPRDRRKQPSGGSRLEGLDAQQVGRPHT